MTNRTDRRWPSTGGSRGSRRQGRVTGRSEGQCDRAVSPVVGSVLLVAVTVLVAAATGAALVGLPDVAAPPPTANIDCTATAATDRITCVHRRGDRLDLRAMRLRVTVGGESLTHQPPVPFFAARGFRAGPTGPFNSAADPYWTAGETAALRLAGTNSPGLAPGTVVVVRLTHDGGAVARERATVA